MQVTVEVTKDEVVEWQKHKVTKAIVERLFLRREEIKETLASANFGADQIDRVIGGCMAYKEIIDYIITDIMKDTVTEEKTDA